jgi:hypothetical protein
MKERFNSHVNEGVKTLSLWIYVKSGSKINFEHPYWTKFIQIFIPGRRTTSLNNVTKKTDSFGDLQPKKMHYFAFIRVLSVISVLWWSRLPKTSIFSWNYWKEYKLNLTEWKFCLIILSGLGFIELIAHYYADIIYDADKRGLRWATMDFDLISSTQQCWLGWVHL